MLTEKQAHDAKVTEMQVLYANLEAEHTKLKSNLSACNNVAVQPDLIRCAVLEKENETLRTNAAAMLDRLQALAKLNGKQTEVITNLQATIATMKIDYEKLRDSKNKSALSLRCSTRVIADIVTTDANCTDEIKNLQSRAAETLQFVFKNGYLKTVPPAGMQQLDNFFTNLNMPDMIDPKLRLGPKNTSRTLVAGPLVSADDLLLQDDVICLDDVNPAPPAAAPAPSAGASGASGASSAHKRKTTQKHNKNATQKRMRK
jgi:hypothetical protein